MPTLKTMAHAVNALGTSEIKNFPMTPPGHAIQRKRREKQLKRARTACMEIYESEKSYVKSLRTLCDSYAIPLRTNKILTPDQHLGLFSNIHQILLLNSKLLEDMAPLAKLRIAMEQDTNTNTSTNNNSGNKVIGGQHSRNQSISNPLETVYDIFHSFTPFLKMYIGYVTNYNTRALSLLPELNNTNTKFVKFCKETRANPNVANLDLNSFLIMPIQRVMRYRILLEVLIKHLTREDSTIVNTQSENIFKLKNALKSITKVSYHIDQSIDQRENMDQVLKISEIVQGNDPRLKNLVSPTRTFIKQGELLRGTRRGKLVLFKVWLFNDMLLYGKLKKSDVENKRKVIDLSVLIQPSPY